MTREKLIETGKKIVEDNCSEEERNQLMELFDNNVPHPKGSNLFYYPDKYNARNTDISKYKPTVEEVVDLCLSYKAFAL